MSGDTVTVFAVVVPLAFVFEAVGTLGNTETATFVVLPFTHVRFRHASVQLFVLQLATEIGVVMVFVVRIGYVVGK